MVLGIYFILFIAICALSWVVNKILKKNLLNGAALFMIIPIGFFLIVVVGAINSGGDTQAYAVMGEQLVYTLVAVIPAWIFARRFKSNKNKKNG